MIRNAEIGDIFEIDRLGRLFHEYGLKQKGLGWNDGSFRKFLIDFIQSENSVCLVSGEDKLIGTIAGFLTPWMLDLSQTILTELWWFVDPEYRGNKKGTKLIEEFEMVGKNRNADFVIMVTHTEMEDRLVDYYKHNNYNHLERQFIKEL